MTLCLRKRIVIFSWGIYSWLLINLFRDILYNFSIVLAGIYIFLISSFFQFSLSSVSMLMTFNLLSLVTFEFKDGKYWIKIVRSHKCWVSLKKGLWCSNYLKLRKYCLMLSVLVGKKNFEQVEGKSIFNTDIQNILTFLETGVQSQECK